MVSGLQLYFLPRSTGDIQSSTHSFMICSLRAGSMFLVLTAWDWDGDILSNDNTDNSDTKHGDNMERESVTKWEKLHAKILNKRTEQNKSK